jgi:hypothetical protein
VVALFPHMVTICSRCVSDTCIASHQFIFISGSAAFSALLRLAAWDVRGGGLCGPPRGHRLGIWM